MYFWMRRTRVAARTCLVLVAAAAGCGSSGEFVWFQQLPTETTRANNEYIIGVGDIVSIRVLGHEEMTLKQRVRADGRLALLLIGEVEANGKRPSALKAELEGRLKDFIVSPSVAVNIDEAEPTTVLLLGEVAKPGAYPLDQDARLAHALALGGGLTDYASRNSTLRSAGRAEIDAHPLHVRGHLPKRRGCRGLPAAPRRPGGGRVARLTIDDRDNRSGCPVRGDPRPIGYDQTRARAYQPVPIVSLPSGAPGRDYIAGDISTAPAAILHLNDRRWDYSLNYAATLAAGNVEVSFLPQVLQIGGPALRGTTGICASRCPRLVLTEG